MKRFGGVGEGVDSSGEIGWVRWVEGMAEVKKKCLNGVG